MMLNLLLALAEDVPGRLASSVSECSKWDSRYWDEKTRKEVSGCTSGFCQREDGKNWCITCNKSIDIVGPLNSEGYR